MKDEGHGLCSGQGAFILHPSPFILSFQLLKGRQQGALKHPRKVGIALRPLPLWRVALPRPPFFLNIKKNTAPPHLFLSLEKRRRRDKSKGGGGVVRGAAAAGVLLQPSART